MYDLNKIIMNNYRNKNNLSSPNTKGKKKSDFMSNDLRFLNPIT